MDSTERILQLVNSQGKNESTLAKECGINITSFSGWKKGKAKPSAEAIVKIANYFNVTADYLLGRTDNPYPSDSLPKETEEVVFFFDKLNDYNKRNLKIYLKGLYEGQLGAYKNT